MFKPVFRNKIIQIKKNIKHASIVYKKKKTRWDFKNNRLKKLKILLQKKNPQRICDSRHKKHRHIKIFICTLLVNIHDMNYSSYKYFGNLNSSSHH